MSKKLLSDFDRLDVEDVSRHAVHEGVAGNASGEDNFESIDLKFFCKSGGKISVPVISPNDKVSALSIIEMNDAACGNNFLRSGIIRLKSIVCGGGKRASREITARAHERGNCGNKDKISN